MFEKMLLFAIAVIGVGAFVATAPENAEYVPKSAHTSSDAEQSDSDWYAGDHSLTREWDGHFYAEAHIDGASVRMMVDTGASVIALTGDDAMAIGLDWSDDEVRNIGSGASGAVYGVPAMLDEVEIGGIARNNVRAVIIPRGLDISLLGQSYLSQINNVRIEDDQMVLGS